MQLFLLYLASEFLKMLLMGSPMCLLLAVVLIKFVDSAKSPLQTTTEASKVADPCSKQDHGCSQICKQKAESPNDYECSCRSGYVLAADKKKCNNINECMDKNGGCPQICRDTVGNFTCACYPGYRLNKDTVTCGDINECKEGKDNCESFQVCINSVGGYACLESQKKDYFSGLKFLRNEMIVGLIVWAVVITLILLALSITLCVLRYRAAKRQSNYHRNVLAARPSKHYASLNEDGSPKK